MTILLTGLTVSIAVFAAAIAVVAIWGYHAIKDDAKGAAELAIAGYLKSIDLRATIAEAAAPIVAEEAAKAFQNLQYSQPIDKPSTIGTGEETEKVAKPYPDTKEGR